MTDAAMAGTITKRPSDCTHAEREDFAALVRPGEQVGAVGLSRRIADAECLTFHYESGVLIGVGGLKNLPLWYRDGIFQQAKSSLRATEFPFELGWVVVAPAQRRTGICGFLVQAMLKASRERNIYAIAFTDNYPMHKCLECRGFTREGTQYSSPFRPGQMIQLFVRPGQISER